MGRMLSDYFSSPNENGMEGEKLKEKNCKVVTDITSKKKSHKENGEMSVIREFKSQKKNQCCTVWV